jgi:hypothetical protein
VVHVLLLPHGSWLATEEMIWQSTYIHFFKPQWQGNHTMTPSNPGKKSLVICAYMCLWEEDIYIVCHNVSWYIQLGPSRTLSDLECPTLQWKSWLTMTIRVHGCDWSMQGWLSLADHTQSSCDINNGLMYSKPSNSDWSILLMALLQWTHTSSFIGSNILYFLTDQSIHNIKIIGKTLVVLLTMAWAHDGTFTNYH